MSIKSTEPLSPWASGGVLILLAVCAWLVVAIMLALCNVGCRSSSVYPIPAFIDPVTHEAPHVIPDH